MRPDDYINLGGGEMVLHNFHCSAVLLIWIIVEQGPTVLAAGVGRGCLDIFSLVYHFSIYFLPFSVGDGPI